MTSPPSRRLRLVLPLLLVLGLLVVGGVAWARTDDRPRAQAGRLFDPAFLQDEIEAVDVVLPWVRATVGIGAPRAELPDALGAEPNVRAPEDGSFVQVQVTADVEQLIPLYLDSPGFEGTADLTLVGGEHRYPLTHVPAGFRLDPATAETGVIQRFLAVEGSPDEWSLEVVYDDLRWTVDLSDGSSEPGPQDTLADLPTVDAASSQQQAEQGCGRATWSRGYQPEEPYYRAECQVVHQARARYVDGLGWAEPGREFLVVQVYSHEPGHATGPGGAHYYVRDPEMTYRLNGREPLAVAEVNDLGGPGMLQRPGDPDQAIFDVAADAASSTLQIRMAFVGEAQEPDAPQGPRIDLDWSVELKEGQR